MLGWYRVQGLEFSGAKSTGFPQGTISRFSRSLDDVSQLLYYRFVLLSYGVSTPYPSTNSIVFAEVTAVVLV